MFKSDQGHLAQREANEGHGLTERGGGVTERGGGGEERGVPTER